VGAGTGLLTERLARCCSQLWAVEVDERLCGALRARFADAPHVCVVHADFLEWKRPAELGARYKLVGNLPYARTAEIVRRLTEGPGASDGPEDAWLVVQLEAARRFAGAPFAPETLRSLSLKPWWQVEIARRLERSDFSPPPAVDSALLWMARRARPLVDDRALYREFLGRAFADGGASVRRRLEPLLSARQVSRLALDLRFDSKSSAAGLGFDQWLGLFRFWARERRAQNRGRH